MDLRLNSNPNTQGTLYFPLIKVVHKVLILSMTGKGQENLKGKKKKNGMERRQVRTRVSLDTAIKHLDFSFQQVLITFSEFTTVQKYIMWTISKKKKEKKKNLPCSSWCITPTRLGSSPHQNIHNSLQSGLTSRRHTHSKLACRQRMKLNRIGSSWAGAEIMGPQSPCPPKLYLRHLIPVSSA